MDNSNKENESVVVKAPKGVGISPKIFSIFIAIVVFLLFMVLVMIFTYKGNKSKTDMQSRANLVSQQSSVSAEDVISQLNKSEATGVLLNQKKSKPAQTDQSNQNNNRKKDQTSSAVSEKTKYQYQENAQAAGSPISVINNFQELQNQNKPTPTNNMNSDDLARQESDLNNMAANALGNLGKSSGAGEYKSQNMQSQKTAFLKSNQKINKKFYLDSELQKPFSPYEILAGGLIPAQLVTAINSDLPGTIIAQVTNNVYDTVTGNYLLIPQGTRVLGTYDNQISYGQKRVLIVWNRLIFPNGTSFDLEGQPGVDLMGQAGLHDLVNNHYTRIFGSALAFSIFGALGQLSQPQQAANSYPTNSQIIYGAIGQNLTEAGIQLTEKNMNIQPTENIRIGCGLNILLTRDMVFPGRYGN